MSATLDEFKDAEQKLGDEERPCSSIPYSDLRRDCCEKGDEQFNNCKIVQWACTGDRDTNATLVNLKRKGDALYKLITSLKVIGETFSSSAEDEQIGNVLRGMIDLAGQELPKIEGSMESLRQELQDRREKLRIRIEFGKRCVDDRRTVMQIFEKAISLAENETDAEITVIASKLIAVWKASFAGHLKSITEALEAIAKCEEMANRTEPR